MRLHSAYFQIRNEKDSNITPGKNTGSTTEINLDY